jgi:hypothetical protein
VNRIRYIFGHSRAQEFEFHGYYYSDYVGSFKRPFLRAVVYLPRFSKQRIVELLVDTGADITTLAARDAILLLEESQFRQLEEFHGVLAVGGIASFYQEGAFVGLFLPNERVCWIPVSLDIAALTANQEIPSALGQDILKFGVLTLDATKEIVRVKLRLREPIIT